MTDDRYRGGDVALVTGASGGRGVTTTQVAQQSSPPVSLNKHTRRRTIALVAQDGKKDELVAFARQNQDALARHHLVATDGTGRLLHNKLGLAVTLCGHGPHGGDVAIAAAVAARNITAVIFFVDPTSVHSHAADSSALIRQCCVHDVPMALNPATAEALAAQLDTIANETTQVSLHANGNNNPKF